MSVQTMADWTGHQLAHNRYLVGRKLGEGGMAIIYLAQDRNLASKVVIKAPRPEMLSDKDFAARFSREIRSLVQLSHPHILKILDVGEHNGFPFAVLQYLPGGSLRERQSRTADERAAPMPPETLHSWLADTAAALDYMHQKGYIHRDIKPDNLLFDEEGNVYLGDFGIAKVLSNQRPETQRTVLTTLGTTIGTPQYMAPELILAQKFDQRVDQYALAVTVYEWLSGNYPFSGNNPTQVFESQLRGAPPALHALVPTIPPSLSAALAKALSKEPKDRFATCVAFVDAVLKTPTDSAAPAIASSIAATVTSAKVPTPAETKPAKRQIVCSQCGTQQSVPHNLSPGAKVRCRKCRTPFAATVVSQTTTPASASAPRASHTDRWQPWQKQLLYVGVPTGILLMVVTLLVLGGLLFGFLFRPAREQEEKSLAEARQQPEIKPFQIKPDTTFVQPKTDDAKPPEVKQEKLNKKEEPTKLEPKKEEPKKEEPKKEEPKKEEPNLKDIIRKAIVAHGGEKNLAKFQASTSTLKGTIEILGAKYDITGEEAMQNPYKSFKSMTLYINNKPQLQRVTVYNGEKMWTSADGKTQEIKDEKVLTNTRETLQVIWAGSLMEFLDKPYELHAISEAKVKDKDAFGIRVSKKGQRDFNLFFDKMTHLIVKSEMHSYDPQTEQEVTLERYLSSYLEKNGLKVARRVVIEKDGQPFMDIEFTGVNILEKLPDNTFAMEESKKEEPKNVELPKKEKQPNKPLENLVYGVKFATKILSIDDVLKRDLTVVNTNSLPLAVRAAENVIVRAMSPPLEYDDRGNIKKWTKKEIDALRGNNPKLPGYAVDLIHLNKGQTIEIYLAKQTPPAKGVGPPPITNRPLFVMIVIVKQ